MQLLQPPQRVLDAIVFRVAPNIGISVVITVRDRSPFVGWICPRVGRTGRGTLLYYRTWLHLQPTVRSIVVAKQTDNMSNTADISLNLEVLGLEHDESRLYVLLGQSGALSVLDASRILDIPRTTTYRLVERLRSKDLVRESDDSSGLKVHACGADSLQRLVRTHQEEVDQQRQLLPSIVGALTNLTGGGPLGIRVNHYAGIDGARQVFMNSLEANDVIRSFTREDMDSFFNYGWHEEVRQEYVRRGLRRKDLMNP